MSGRLVSYIIVSTGMVILAFPAMLKGVGQEAGAMLIGYACMSCVFLLKT